MSINGNYRKDFTALKDYKQAEFTGLTRKVLKPLEVALEHTKKIQRFWNDKHVDTKTYELPNLYDHIFSGLALAKNDVFAKLEKLQDKGRSFQKDLRKFSEKFNRAFLVHDFGEMFMEFSTVFGRYGNRESTKLGKDERDIIENQIAELVFNGVEVLNPKWFSKFFSEKCQDLINTEKYDEKIELAKEFIKEGQGMVKRWKSAIPDSVSELNDFVNQWMSDFDISQSAENLKDSLTGNLVKVVDKLEDIWRASQIHDPKKLTGDFRRVLIASYMKAYNRLIKCTEAQQAKPNSVEAEVLKQVDKLIKARFKKDNTVLRETTPTKAFTDFNQARSKAYDIAV